MIYTVTTNPSIDYVMQVDQVQLGTILRTQREALVFGGKGINVSRMLQELGMSSTALGFVAGFTGEALAQGLRKEGILTDFITVEEGHTRINVKLHAQEETEINGQGPAITSAHIQALMAKLKVLTKGDILVLSGNIQNSIPQSLYADIMKTLSKKEVMILVDAQKEALRSTLAYHPFLIKPNKQELEEMFHTTLNKQEDVVKHARILQQEGARNVIVSMAKDGALLVSEDGELYEMPVCQGEVVNSVGAGDSMVAGFLYGYLKTHDMRIALQYGTACGGATAFSTGIAKKEKIDCCLAQLKGEL